MLGHSQLPFAGPSTYLPHTFFPHFLIFFYQTKNLFKNECEYGSWHSSDCSFVMDLSENSENLVGWVEEARLDFELEFHLRSDFATGKEVGFEYCLERTSQKACNRTEMISIKD
jgi:hypothetical protein